MIQEVRWDDCGPELILLRRNCWRSITARGVGEDLADSHDMVSNHAVYRQDGLIIGAVRCSTHADLLLAPWGGEFLKCAHHRPGPFAVMSRLAVDPKMQGSGIGRRLLDAIIGTAKMQGAQTIFGATSNPAIAASLLRRGFTQISVEYCFPIPPTHRATAFAL